jgi:hypothetical protein
MAVIPAVYVTIEDKSFALPSVGTGRVGFVVILSDRGPHNQVVELNSQEDLFLKFGRPQFDRTGHGHYMANNFLKFSNRLLVVRPSLMDSPVEEENSAIANFYIKYNADSGSKDSVDASEDRAFIFTKNDPHVIVNHAAWENLDVGEYIYPGVDNEGSATDAWYIDPVSMEHIPLYRKILDKNINGNGQYQLIIDSALDNYIFTGTSNTIELRKVIRYFPGSYAISYKDTSGNLVDSQFSFFQNKNEVLAADAYSFNSAKVRDWIYPADAAFDGSLSRQIIDKVVDQTNPAAPIYKLVLDSNFLGSDIVSGAYRYNILEVDSTPNLRNPDGNPPATESQSESDALSSPANQPAVEATDPDNIWYFTSTGAGTWSNNLYYEGVRNTELEKMYTDANGDPVYKYAFMDLILKHQNADGTSTLLEGPFTVSLIRTTYDGQVIKDIYTGNELYIENVINNNSEYVRCTPSLGAEMLLRATNAELVRLNVQALFANEKVYRTDVIGYNGIMFAKGDDGCQYDSRGKLNISHPMIKGLLMKVFNTELISADGSIENLDNTLYPLYQIDYIISGGFAPDVQNAARSLADRRQDCMVLADTGGYYRGASQDLQARAQNVPWNTWNAMIYTQYQRMFDQFTGKYLWFSPVYNAIERHLEVDSKYWIAEPVAGIEKGAIQSPMTLSYRPKITELQDLIDKELNPVIVEPDGTYILTQLTTWKRLSIMKRAHAVKFVHFIKKRIPSLLKDILQRKMTAFWINLADQRVKAFMARYVDGANGSSERFTAISTFSCQVIADEARSELNVILTIKPIRAIESINVSILVI